MMLDTGALMCFLAIVDTGSVTQAAARLGKTQSAVSQQILKLESQLGVALFRRDRRLVLTPSGELLVSYASQIIQLCQDAVAAVRPSLTQRTVRLGISDEVGQHHLVDCLRQINAQFPNVVVEIEGAESQQLMDRFQRREFDFVIAKTLGSAPRRTLFVLQSEPLVWAGNADLVRPGYAVPLAVSPAPDLGRAAAVSALTQSGWAYEVVFSRANGMSVMAAVNAGVGITVLPASMVPDGWAIYGAGLPSLPTIALCVFQRQRADPMLDLVLDVLRTHFPDLGK